MAHWKIILIGVIIGSLVTGGALGTLAYQKIKALDTENTRLALLVKKQDWRHENLSKSQASLSDELNRLKEQREKGYDETIGALIQAKDNAGIEALYEIGLKALQEKDAPRAYFALAQVQKINPKFKEISKQFPLAKNAYDQHQKKVFEEELQQAYLSAFDHQAKGQYAQAKAGFQRVVATRPKYKDAQARLATVSRQLETQTKTLDLAQKKKWLEATYKLGFNQQALGRYAEATAAYGSILQVAPKFKDTPQRYKTVKALVPAAPPATAADQANNCYALGATLGRCTRPGANDPACASPENLRIPPECKNSPEFQKGLRSAMGTAPGVNSDPANEPPIDNDAMLKGLSNMFKNFGSSGDNRDDGGGIGGLE